MVPVSSPHERGRRRQLFGAQLFLQRRELPLGRRWQRPLLHFPVRRGAEIGESSGRDLSECSLAGCQLDLAGRLQALHRLEEVVQPAGAVDPILRPWPPAELLPVVREHREPMALSAELFEVGRGFFRRAEGDQVAEPLVDREQPDALAVGFRMVWAVQLVVTKAAGQEMTVIDERVFDAGRREIGGQFRLPHALGEPQPGRLDAEAALQVFAHPPDLLEPIGAG